MIFKKSLRDSPGFLLGVAPSNSLINELPQQFVKSAQLRQSLE